MICDAQWALALQIAAFYLFDVSVEIKSLVDRHQVTTFAQMSSIEADVEGDIAAESALVVDELFSVP